MPLVTVTVDGAARRRIAILDGIIVRDKFKESDHPRAGNGQFGSGSKAHIVTTSDGETTTFHHVGSDAAAASDAHDEAEADDDSAEYHAPEVEGSKGDRSSTVHVVHAQDGSGGVDVHGAHLEYGSASGQAHELSKGEWEDSGPTRSEAGLSDLEKVDVAQAWNDEHAEDHDDVQVKVDQDGDPILDEDGDFQFTQDGVDVDPGDDIRAAFDEVSEEMYPGDETAAYPGLDAANDHFTDQGRHEAVFRIHTHKAG